MRDRYFDWLKEQIDFLEFGDEYDMLLKKLYSLPYKWIIRMDENRAADAIAMREQICNEYGYRMPKKPCSFLEFLTALAFRMHYICDAPEEWRIKEFFWRLLSNLGINTFSNDVWTPECERVVEQVVERICTNSYEVDGSGGLFPMSDPRQNQRNIEIWYQMNQYIRDPNGRDLRYL